MPVFKHEGITLNYKIQGTGVPFLYLHGLGDNLQHAFDTYQPKNGIQLIALDQRGHGKSNMDHKAMSFETLASDALALMNYLGIDKFYIGGLSMGAGVVVNLAVHQSERLLGLILIRSAWTEQSMDKQIALWFKTVSNYLAKPNGRELFHDDPIFQSIEQVYPRAIETFNRYFDDKAAIQYYQKFIDMPQDQPFKNKSELKRITVPVLILSNDYDMIHPLSYGYFYQDNIKKV
ncbi:alpha/beta hydrolase [Listeria weihenstephanensis]|uniref:Alpha/beta hydrolase n=1 Tax=Listeria weihenstephanensis TaxID=1006155 RepID=A0A841Z6K2_9LIST|nr:alpha/beta hydrolase [Listeria weihenstephanensis]MBC1499993.1 alpha/beta hydrolase [Listeria weihenstephanensis]